MPSRSCIFTESSEANVEAVQLMFLCPLNQSLWFLHRAGVSFLSITFKNNLQKTQQKNKTRKKIQINFLKKFFLVITYLVCVLVKCIKSVHL